MAKKVRKLRNIKIGVVVTPDEQAEIIRTSATHTVAAQKLQITPDQARQLAWRLREGGKNCGPLREGGRPINGKEQNEVSGQNDGQSNGTEAYTEPG